jgi:hypothetical protein
MNNDDNDRVQREILAALQRMENIAIDNSQILGVIAAEQIASKQLLQLIVDNTNPHYSIEIRRLPMALGTIAPGSTGQFGAVLLNNGVPDTSSFVPSFTFTSSDTSATFAPATVDASGGTIPLANQAVLSVPTGDTSTSTTITASTVDPNGATQTGTVTVTISGGGTTAVYTVGVTQLA